MTCAWDATVLYCDHFNYINYSTKRPFKLKRDPAVVRTMLAIFPGGVTFQLRSSRNNNKVISAGRKHVAPYCCCYCSEWNALALAIRVVLLVIPPHYVLLMFQGLFCVSKAKIKCPTSLLVVPVLLASYY